MGDPVWTQDSGQWSIWMPRLYQQHNMLPWRPALVCRRGSLLSRWGSLLIFVILLIAVSAYLLHGQRQQQLVSLQQTLQAHIQLSQQRLLPQRQVHKLWLRKQAATADWLYWQQQSQHAMQALLLLQNMLRDTQGHFKSVQIQTTGLNVHLVTQLSWSRLASGWWLPPAATLLKVEKAQPQAPANATQVEWHLQVEIAP